jgi:hypothetical protein
MNLNLNIIRFPLTKFPEDCVTLMVDQNGGGKMKKYGSFSGTVTMIQDYLVGSDEELKGCFKLMSLLGGDGSIVNFVISPTTYFLDHVMVSVGDRVTGFYDVNVPVILIYPPQYQALIIVKDNPYQNVKVDYFNSQLVSIDGQLQLNISSNTPIVLQNDQPFTLNPGNRNLLVVFGPVTFSIPAHTTPYKIIVLC